MGKNIVIVGGGISGLAAAKVLSENNMQVVMLEARDRLGGRIHSLSHESKIVLETGAEFVHGKLPATFELIREYRLPVEEIKGRMITLTPPDKSATEKDWAELFRQMKAMKADLPFASFLDKFFAGENYSNLRNAAKQYAAGFDLADPETASTMALYEEWSEEEQEQYRIRGGYKMLVEALHQDCVNRGCTFHKAHIVRTIDWEKNKVRIITANGKSFSADKAMLTLPVGVWQSRDIKQGYIEFNPSLSHKIEQFDKIGFGPVVKILLLFSSSFWNAAYEDAGFFFTGTDIPTWWTQSPQQNGLLTGWLGGPMVNALKQKFSGDIIGAALHSLSKAFGIPLDQLRKNLIASEITDWQQEPFSGGGYSFSTIASDKARKNLNEPVDDTLFFSGEALDHSSMAGTVEAAIKSGQECAERMLTVNG